MNISLPTKHFIVRFDVFKPVAMKNVVFWDVMPCGSLRIDVSAERITSIIRVKTIGEQHASIASYC
jgi:hypothetical protein